MSSAPSLELHDPQVRPRSTANPLICGLMYSYKTIAGLPWVFWCMFAIGIIAMVLLAGGIRSARESARRGASICKMMGIMIAHQNYHDRHGRYPAAGDKAKSQLSWRVRLIPYLGEDELYAQFHLNESWDSEHNRALIPRMPDAYCSLAAEDLPAGKTVFLAVTGPGTAFGDGKKGPTLKDLKDGSSKTVLIVEADRDQAVIWTKPDDWEFDPSNPMHGLGHLYQYSQRFLVGFADSHTEGIDVDTPPETIKAMMTRNGGEREPLP